MSEIVDNLVQMLDTYVDDGGYHLNVNVFNRRCSSASWGVTGYTTGNYKTAFNLGKQEEVEDRVKHLQ